MATEKVLPEKQEDDEDMRTKLLCFNFRSLNRKLLVSKVFYFCYWGAVGSFFPLLGVYFKQLGMNPYLSGILVGCRPMVEFFSAPLLGSLADRLNKRKLLMLFSLACWISFNFSLAFIKPAPVRCRKYFILTENVSQIVTGETSEIKDFLAPNTPDKKEPEFKAKSSLVFDREGVHQVFLVLLFLTVVGEFFSAPAITLADSATLGLLGENKELYGRQRMWGSLGWGAAMFLLGFVIDSIKGVEVCGEIISQNYTVGFYFFFVFMVCALTVATRFSFPNKETSELSDSLQQKETGLYRILFSFRYGTFFVVTFFLGFGVGLIFTFLFWHLEDLGGPPTLFGIASLIDHISEIACYFNVGRLICFVGHIRVLYIGLFGNFLRFIYISFLENPWLVLPLEILQGVTHAAVWAACTSYVGRIAPPGYATSAQGILQGLHHGLGRGCGAILGGVLIHEFGTNVTFRLYGVASLVVLVLFAILQKILGPDERMINGARPNLLDVTSKAKHSPDNSPDTDSPPSVVAPVMPGLFSHTNTGEPNFGVVGRHVQPRSTTS